MTFLKYIFTLITVLILSAPPGKCQHSPIGSWESHLIYNTAVGVVTDGKTIFSIGTQAFHTVESNGNIVPYSKVDGMASIGMQCIGYDAYSSSAILVYGDGNIDIFKNNTFYNIPDFKLKQSSITKTIFSVYAENGIAYLSSTLGVLVLDILNQQIIALWELNKNTPRSNNTLLTIYDFKGVGNYFYIATNFGLYRISKNNPGIQNLQSWQIVDSLKGITHLSIVNNQLYGASLQKVYVLSAEDSLINVYNTIRFIHHIDAGNNNLFISEYLDSTLVGAVKIMPVGDSVNDSFSFYGIPKQVVQLADNSVWVADSVHGLRKRTGSYETSFIMPDGPNSPFCYDIYAHNKNLYIAHGGYDNLLFAFGQYTGFSYYYDNKWTLYNHDLFSQMGTARDFVVLTKDESTGDLYAGSYQDGLFILKNDSFQKFGSTEFDPSLSNGPIYQITGMTFDHNNNLWMNLLFAQHQLYVKTNDNRWFKYAVPVDKYGGPMVADNNNQLYFVDLSGGLEVFNTNGTIAYPADDASYHLAAGAGFGNLPSNDVFCVAKDDTNDIWVGTNNGMCVIHPNTCKSPFANSGPCEATQPSVHWGASPGYLFAGKDVNTIAVDPANRKWVGTDDGVWLLSPDCQEVIYNFTVDNSPIPENHIQKIAIDDVTGDVYIGTYLGVVSFHGNATEGTTSNQAPLIFPNPVPAGYNGPIAINGLMTNSDIRITDINGQLVYKTKVTSGGEVIWNGKDYAGHRPQSGVYLVFIAGSDGKQTNTQKIIFLQ